MYQIGDHVVYGIHGVCRIADFEQRRMDGKQVTYLVLEPAGQGGSRYFVPTHNAAAMAKVRYILTRQELEALLASEEVRSGSWIADENQRKQLYRELISSGDRLRLLKMIFSLYGYRASQLAKGKKVHLSDDNFLRDAEKLLCGEIAAVLALSHGEALEYLRKKLKEDA